ncbi:NAD-binding protein [Oscillatoria sp. CS-180]|uniref:potassium channel family protein n=1 Tax=Oscillatoria sp. CS-180 TaxID=3021720 RepID=UPI00232C846B|nr:NAD-binding protein [Oscillatoria sp. CS-180]MDB9527835.1 NAD-binding protein [Oscillatoria sp. CS-180]
MKPKIIVCGLGDTGYRVFSLLQRQGVQVVGISNQPSDESNIIVGDMRSPDTLIRAGIHDALALLLMTSDDALNLAILTQARVLNPRIRIINRLLNTRLGDRLDQTLDYHVSMSVSELAGPIFAFAALGNTAIGQIDLMGANWPMYEEYISERHPWNGALLRHLWENRDRMLIYYCSANQKVDLVSAVLTEQRLETGDRLIIATRPKTSGIQRLTWERRLKSFFAGLTQFRRQSQAALFITLILLLLITFSTLLYLSVNFNVSIPDALYFTVGMLTGAGGHEEVAEQAPVAVKVFTAVMMLVGAGVIGVFYAILNDLVLGSHFHQVWNAVQLPQRHHYVVCGLGGVGFQIAKQLKLAGYDVVAIERDPHGRFVNSAKALKIPVITEDASVPDILNSVHVSKALALLAVTSHDTDNLEIALTAKSLAPKLPIVVRNQDPHFSRQVQQVFGFEQVLSPIELAAPSFAAAALGGQVLGNGITGHSLWVALGTLITPAHPFFGRTIANVAAETDLVPLYVETPQSTIHGFDLLSHVLNSQDVLYLTIPANQLEELWRTVPSQLTAH